MCVTLVVFKSTSSGAFTCVWTNTDIISTSLVEWSKLALFKKKCVLLTDITQDSDPSRKVRKIFSANLVNAIELFDISTVEN